MAKREGRWVKALAAGGKLAVASACERFVADVLKPRFLPEIRPTGSDYLVDISGKWRGSKYAFLARYRSGWADNAGEEFDAAFARLDHLEDRHTETLFDVMWLRHTGGWWRLYAAVPLGEALRLIDTDSRLQPFV